MRCDRAVSGRWCPAARLCAVLLCTWTIAGCNAWSPPSYVPPELAFGPPPPQPNPVLVTVMDRDLVWDQVVDVVDDYFRIQQEERVRLVGDLLTEGRLDTYPRGGSTIFEPWNGDSADLYERWESTLQSIRRTALVRIIPAEAGFLVDVQVNKELEDVSRPETGAISSTNTTALRNDAALRRVTNPLAGPPPTIGWIPQGRDTALEQEILTHIQARLSNYGPPHF
jgi:hypothetical protein